MIPSSPATSPRGPLLLLVLAGALGACGDDPSDAEPGPLLVDRFSHDFGRVRIGESSAEQVFTFRNGGAGTLENLRLRLEPGGPFDVRGTTCAGRLEPSRTCTVTIAFEPVQGGGASGDLVVEGDDVEASASLSGEGAVTVRVEKLVAGEVLVKSTPPGIECGFTCEATFIEPEIVLSLGTEGIAEWPAPCETTPEGDCLLALTGDTVITLQTVVGLAWTHDSSAHSAIAFDAQNNVIAARGSTAALFKVSPTGDLLWENSDLDVGVAVAADAQGNIGFGDARGLVARLDGDGNVQWSLDGAETGFTQIVDMAFDPAGALFVAGTQGPVAEDFVTLVKLDRDGNQQWSVSHDPGLSHSVIDLVVDGAGNAIVSGRGRTGSIEDGLDLAFVRKYDGNGDLVWARDDAAGELAVDADGNLFLDLEPELHKYTPDGTLLWKADLGDGVSGISALTVTPAGDVIAAGTHDAESVPASVWAAKFDGADGTRHRPLALQGEVPFYGHIAADGNGDVVLAGAMYGFGLRKYEAVLFDRTE